MKKIILSVVLVALCAYGISLIYSTNKKDQLSAQAVNALQATKITYTKIEVKPSGTVALGSVLEVKVTFDKETTQDLFLHFIMRDLATAPDFRVPLVKKDPKEKGATIKYTATLPPTMPNGKYRVHMVDKEGTLIFAANTTYVLKDITITGSNVPIRPATTTPATTTPATTTPPNTPPKVVNQKIGIGRPTQNVVWKHGSSQRITWRNQVRNVPVDIYLGGGTMSAPIKLKSTNSSTGGYTNSVPDWTGATDIKIPSATQAPAGTGYYIYFTMNNEPVGVSQPFEISANPGPIVVNLPGTTLKKGTTYTISWNRADDSFSSSMNVYMVGGDLKGNGYGHGRKMAETSSRSVQIRIPTDIKVGKYKFELTQTNTHGIYDEGTVVYSASFDVVE